MKRVILVPAGYPTSSSVQAVRTVLYLECQRNHAANIGGYAVDGCREFLASGPDGSEVAFICAACGCHRSFHRRATQMVPDPQFDD